jgi:UDP-N-acetylglucosamine:LPS N-acetylglucosamine transferase
MRKKKVLLTLTGGGFLWEAQSLANGLGSGLEYHYVTVPDAKGKVGVIDLPSGEVHFIEKITTMRSNSFSKKLGNSLVSFIGAYRVIRKVKPQAVICVGTSIAVPLCFWAKVFGIKSIFVESITRVTKPSLTGRILSAFRLCDRLYVQWPEAEGLYRGAVYRGTVL